MNSASPWIALALLATAGCLEAPPDPPALAQTPQLIVGGKTASTSEFPTVVAVMFYGSVCTGTLIHPAWVLTAAHCLEGLPPDRVRVALDDDDVNDGDGKLIDAAQLIVHPQYDERFWDNDLGLIKLDTPVTDRAPSPIRRTSITPGTDVMQVGFGDTSDGLGRDGVLRKLATQTIDCATIGSPQYQGDRLLCYSSADGDGTCYGDSGGPSFVKVAGKRYLVGVTSGGTDDSCKRGYDLETLVPAELDFLTSNVMGLAADDGVGNGVPERNDVQDLPDSQAETAGCSTTSAPVSGALWVIGLVIGVGLRGRSRRHDARGRRMNA